MAKQTKDYKQMCKDLELDNKKLRQLISCQQVSLGQEEHEIPTPPITQKTKKPIDYKAMHAELVEENEILQSEFDANNSLIELDNFDPDEI